MGDFTDLDTDSRRRDPDILLVISLVCQTFSRRLSRRVYDGGL